MPPCGNGDGEYLLADDRDIPPQVRPFIVERDLAGLAAVLTGANVTIAADWLDTTLDEDRSRRLAATWSLTTDVRPNRPGNRIVGRPGLLDVPLPQADPNTARVAERQCRKLLEQRLSRVGVAGQVRSRLMHTGRFPTMQEVADELHLDPRTLRRRLTAEGTSYRDLIAQARHAFTRWTGMPPATSVPDRADDGRTGTGSGRWCTQMPMTATHDGPLRVIQWTTGNIGRRSLHAIINRPDMELVGVYAHGADKVGLDAAELAGWPLGPDTPTGVTATNDIDALLATQPDACCYNPLWPSIDELERLLEAGVNVCSSAAWITGGKQTPEDLHRIRTACARGNSTIFGSGAHPGMTNMVGMVLSGSCERVDEIRITESVDCSTYESAGTQTAMGFSCDPETPGLAESVAEESAVFAESAAMMADAIGAELDRMTFDVTFTTATGDTDLGFMTIPEGTVGGVMGYHRGWVGDRNVVSVGFNWIMGNHVTPPKPLEHGHVIQVFGVPNMRTVLHCLPPKDWTEPGFMGLGMIYTAMPVTNAVPAVVAAPTGVVTLKDLPPVTGRFG